MSKIDLTKIEEQIYSKRREVRYDIRDLTVEYISNKYEEGIPYSEVDEEERKAVVKKRNVIFIPEYQRDFTWDEKRQSKLVESILLGLPIPFIFVAENKDGAWEIVDGSQRIRTIHSFIKNKLTLINLESLDSANNIKFENLDSTRQGKFLDSALRIIVLSEETTEDVKKDMFERINRGSDLLKPMEKRKGIYTGPFTSFIYDYAENNIKFKDLLKIDKWLEKRQERSELLLRFFALSENNNYKKGVSGGISAFLDKFIERKNQELIQLPIERQEEILKAYEKKINNVVDIVDKLFPFGFRHVQNPQTKRSVFEAISVGTYLAIQSNSISQKLKEETIKAHLKSKNFKQFTHVANELHKQVKLKSRVEYIRDMLEGKYND